MSVWYIDTDDEITDAVARLRSTDEGAVVLVVPAGSRIATGRINFKLLAREAASRDKSIAIVSDDEQVRALVAAAGVLGYERVADAEAALKRGDTPPEPTPPLEGSVEGDLSTPLDTNTAAGDWLTRRRAVSGIVGVMLGLIVVGGIATLQVLPSAQITITPRVEHVGPIAVAVTAASSIDAVDVRAGEIPAVALSIPLEVNGTFPAGGSETLETKAVGEVVFSSTDQSFDQTIAPGTRVQTAAGVAFNTTAAAVLRRPTGDSGPASVRAPVEAITAGPSGNVVAGAISVVPSLESQGISVTNETAAEGGNREEAAVVTGEAYDAAAVDLQNRLAGELASELRDPENVPEGLTLFAQTARLGSVTHTPAADDVVGTRMETFELSAATTAQALAVDETLVEAVAIERLTSETPAGSALVPATVSAEPGTGTARGDVIRYAAIAEGDAAVVVDPQTVLDLVRGLPVSEAQAILEVFGTVDVTMWPDFLDDLPADVDRITLEVEER